MNKENKKKFDNGIVRYDPLKAYLREIKAYPRLSAEEELKLALKLYEKADQETAYKLISANLWLVVKIAREYQKLAKNTLDLIQEGNMGLMEAVKKFNPHKGARLPTYATWWIKAYIIRYIMANWRMVKIGTTQAQRKLFFNLSKEKARLEREGFNPTTKLLAQNLDVKESEVIEMEKRMSASDLSVDAPIRNDQESSDYHNLLPADQPDAEDLLQSKELDQLLNQAIKDFSETLNPKQLEIFNSRLLSEDKVIMAELAEKLDISIERVRQIENQVKTKFHDFLKENYENITFLQD